MVSGEGYKIKTIKSKLKPIDFFSKYQKICTILINVLRHNPNDKRIWYDLKLLVWTNIYMDIHILYNRASNLKDIFVMHNFS